MDIVKFLPAGDSAITVEFGREISKELNKKVHALNIIIKERDISGIIETVPTFRSLLVYYNSLILDYDDIIKILKEMMDKIETISLPPPKIIELPVLYGGEEGPDLDYVAQYHNISSEDVIKIHTATNYLIYCLGFTPGFPIMGGLSPDIATPRLKTPRTVLPANSVGIGGNQTGAYPIESPGGWQIIGRMPIKLFDPDRENPILLSAGMYVRFFSINHEEYNSIKAQVEQGTYEYKMNDMEV